MTVQMQLRIGSLIFALVSIAFAVSLFRLSHNTESAKPGLETATSLDRAAIRQ
jgi:hypothetical protein